MGEGKVSCDERLSKFFGTSMAVVKVLFRNLTRINSNLFLRRCSTTCSKVDAIDWDYYTNASNFVEVASNAMARNAPADLKSVLEKLQELIKVQDDPAQSKILKEDLAPVLFWLPNKTHPRVAQIKSEEPVTIGKVGEKAHFTYFPAAFSSLTKRLNILRTKHLGHMSGHRSYFLKGDLALLEQALVRFALSKLRKRGFQLISVPNIVPRSFLENCGFRTQNKHSQVFHLENSWAPDLCLSGTSEMALAAYLSDEIHDFSNLPVKLCAVSRCYRAEAKKSHAEKGIFRVHFFTKVEMFGITSNETGEESESLLEEFTSIQQDLFTDLGLHFKIQEMPPNELGLPAYHKIDMEAWIPTLKMYGEVSSASNCTDYQSRRAGIKYISPSAETKFCHTVNATACAIPRLLITILENFQNLDGSVNIPKPLQKYMKKEVIKERFRDRMVTTKPSS